jgi:hypothetical protein
MGISASTIESDLRLVYSLLHDLRQMLDGEKPERVRHKGQEAE